VNDLHPAVSGRSRFLGCRFKGRQQTRLDEPAEYILRFTTVGEGGAELRMPERLQQQRDSGGVRSLRHGGEVESAQYFLAPERGHCDQQLKIGANGIRETWFGHHLSTLFQGHFVEVHRAATIPDGMVGNGDVFDQHVQYAILPLR
jgi:hypothetical protein